MTREEKDLLLRDLCGRLPYGIKAKANDITVVTINGIVKRQSLTGHFDYDIITDSGNFYLKEVKPYLRPMSSMTEEEMIDFLKVTDLSQVSKKFINDFKSANFGIMANMSNYARNIDWLNKNMFDYRGLIPRSCAIAVTKENNPYKD